MSRCRHAVRLCACVIARHGGAGRAVEIDQDFRKELLPGLFELNRTGKEHATRTENGLLIAIPSGVDIEQTGLILRELITGDFEATLEFELPKVEKPNTGYGSGIMMWAMTDGPWGRLSIGRSEQNSDRLGAVFTAYCILPGAKSDVRGKKFVPAQSRAGGLRLARTGADCSFQVSEDGGPYREIRRETIGTMPVGEIDLFADTGRATTALEVLLKSFKLRADGSVGAVSAPGRGRGMTTLIVIAGVVAAVLLAGAWRMRRRPPVPAAE
jgi:hypothetical protein